MLALAVASRGRSGAIALNRGYELSLKALIAMLLPIAVGLVVWAEPLIDLIYGARVCRRGAPVAAAGGVMTVLFGVNSDERDPDDLAGPTR